MKSLILILAFFSASAFAQTDDVWFQYTETKDFLFSMKIGSFQPTKDGGRVLQRVQDKSSTQIRFRLVEMKTKDCKQGFGFVYSNNLEGVVLDKFDYVENGGTVAQTLATAICQMITSPKSV